MAGNGGARPNAGRKPGKVSQAKKDIATKAKKYGGRALKVLVEVMEDKGASSNSRVAAANHLLDRGYGKPMQAVEVAGKGGEQIAFTGFLIDRATKPDTPDAD